MTSISIYNSRDSNSLFRDKNELGEFVKSSGLILNLVGTEESGLLFSRIKRLMEFRELKMK
jgi:hypothetical protein